jgi:hypothetical protein
VLDAQHGQKPAQKVGIGAQNDQNAAQFFHLYARGVGVREHKNGQMVGGATHLPLQAAAPLSTERCCHVTMLTCTNYPPHGLGPSAKFSIRGRKAHHFASDRNLECISFRFFLRNYLII